MKERRGRLSYCFMKHEYESSFDVADHVAHYWIMSGNGFIIGVEELLSF